VLLEAPRHPLLNILLSLVVAAAAGGFSLRYMLWVAAVLAGFELQQDML
jgi:hypothetical protein